MWRLRPTGLRWKTYLECDYHTTRDIASIFCFGGVFLILSAIFMIYVGTTGQDEWHFDIVGPFTGVLGVAFIVVGVMIFTSNKVNKIVKDRRKRKSKITAMFFRFVEGMKLEAGAHVDDSEVEDYHARPHRAPTHDDHDFIQQLDASPLVGGGRRSHRGRSSWSSSPPSGGHSALVPNSVQPVVAEANCVVHRQAEPHTTLAFLPHTTSTTSTLRPHTTSTTSTLLPHTTSTTSTLLPHTTSTTSTLLPHTTSTSSTPSGNRTDHNTPLNTPLNTDLHLVHTPHNTPLSAGLHLAQKQAPEICEGCQETLGADHPFSLSQHQIAAEENRTKSSS